MACRCEGLPERLQTPAHAFHSQIEHRARQVAQLAPRYWAALRPKPAPDREVEAMIEASRARLRAMHQAGERYLPRRDQHLERRTRDGR